MSSGSEVSGYTCPACKQWCGFNSAHTCNVLIGFPLGPMLPERKEGWLCPKCQKAHAPWVETCPEPYQSFISVGMSGVK